ncbi:MAG TPA: signal peptidase I [Vicinamibacterales bacterium]|nr:signal peptidase I [Vicinamibacterales bacterium]
MARVGRLLVGSNPRRTFVRVVILIAASAITFGWILLPIRAEGISMLPTYESGTLHFVNRLSYIAASPARGDVIAIRLAGDRVYYVKRVVALPGERVQIVDGTIHVNDVPLSEPYVKNRRPWNVDEVALTYQEYFVVGDNRGMNAADHDFGRAQRSRIVGRVVF